MRKKKFEGNSDTLIDGEFLHTALRLLFGMRMDRNHLKLILRMGKRMDLIIVGIRMDEEIERTFKNGKWVGQILHGMRMDR